MAFKETKSSEGLLTVLGVVGGLMGSALLGVLLNPPTVLQQPSQAGVQGLCANDTEQCTYLQTMFTISVTFSFTLVMLSVIMCLGVAMEFTAWLALALIFFQLSLWGLAVALVAAAWMLMHSQAAIAVSVMMGVLVSGSLWALRPPLCLGWYMCFRPGNVSDVLHWTLSESWARFHIVSRIAMVRVLLSCGADVNAVQRHTPLPIDDTGGDGQASSCVASDNKPEAILVTPLMRAVANPCVSADLVHLLLYKGADVDSRDHQGRTALHVAVQRNNPDLVELLLDHSADAVAADFEGKTPLLMALIAGRESGADRGLAKRIRKMLEGAGADFGKAMEMGHDNVLFQAAMAGDLALVRHEVEDVGEDVNLLGQRSEGYYMTPLMAAVYHEHADVVEYLLEQEGIELEVATKNQGATALHIAADSSRVEIVQLLLRHGANINAVTCPSRSDSSSCKHMPSSCAPIVPSRPGATPLWVACARGCTEVVRLLLHHRPKPSLDVCDGDGDTPLMMAACKGHTEIVRMLVESGANIYKHGRWYVSCLACTAASYAAAGGHADSLRIILSKDAEKSKFFTCHEQFTALLDLGSDKHEVLSVLKEADGAPTEALADIAAATDGVAATIDGVAATDVAACNNTTANLTRPRSLVCASGSASTTQMDGMASPGNSLMSVIGDNNV